VLENRMERKIFVPKRDEITGGWRKVFTEKLHNLYPSPVVIIKSSKVELNGQGM
jgi:hypothetical protein